MTPDANDLAALELAMAKYRQDPRRAAQINDKLAHGEPWAEVARFASYCCQVDALHLKLWERPPCHADWPTRPNQPPDLAGKRLLERMLAAGVSRYHPDPLGALDDPNKI